MIYLLHCHRRIADRYDYQGYDKEHVDIELLRLKNFTLGARLSDEEVAGAKGLERIAELIACLVPFVSPPFPRVHQPGSSPGATLSVVAQAHLHERRGLDAALGVDGTTPS